MSARQAALSEANQAERSRKVALLDLIAKRRTLQGPKGIAGLEDSSEDEGGYSGFKVPAAFGVKVPADRAAQQVVLLDDSSDEEDSSGTGGGENRASNSGDSNHSRGGLAPVKPLGRLMKQGDLGRPARPQRDGSDDLAAQLGGLSINHRPASKPPEQPLRLPAVHVSRKPPLPQRQPQHDSSEEEEEEEAEDAECLTLGERGQFKLGGELAKKLYAHQVDGVKWLWRLQETGSGGILADDMGLGKTMQCSAFLAGLLQCKLIRRAMVIAPKTLLAHWAKELGVCGVGRITHEFFGTESERQRCLDRVYRQRGVLLTTYGMVLHNSEALSASEEHDPDEGALWDVMILDEGHKIKNPRMQLRKHLDAIPARIRVIISGTPIQNNLQEMHTLFDFACPGLLGDARTFKDQYEKKITIGNDKHATQGERERGAVAAAQLRQAIAPFFLRREKKDVFRTSSSEEAVASSNTQPEAAITTGAAKPAKMGRKNDFIVWLRLKPMQRKVYEAFLNSDSVKAALNQTNSALSAITVLKKICDHPALLSKRAEKGIVSGANRAKRLQLAAGERESEIESGSSDGDYSPDAKAQSRRKKQPAATQAAEDSEAGVDWWDWAKEGTSDELLDEVHTTGFEASCKTVFVMALLHNLVAEGHRTLIFSQSRVMLNILEAAITEEGWRFCRIDGSVASTQEREARVKRFQTSSDIPIFLLTSQVGGLGLTLTAADRVVVVDPAWNPSMDNQAVDRAYRIGQKRDVVVYRLISCGTVEEKIYRKQVYKGGLSRTGTEDGEQFRYFTQQELRDLFRLDAAEAEKSVTQQALHELHTHQRKATPELVRHLKFLEGLEGFAGVSDHDLLYSKKDREAPPSAAKFGLQPPEATPGLSLGGGGGGAGGSHRPQGPKQSSAIKKTATQGWSGAGDISDMFSRTLNLGGGGSSNSSGAAAAVAPGRGLAPPPFILPTSLQSRRASDKELQQEKVDELEERLRKQKSLLSLGTKLPDGGAKVRTLIAELEQQLAVERAKLVGGGSAASNGSSSSSTSGIGGESAATSGGSSRVPAQSGPAASSAGGGAALAGASKVPSSRVAGEGGRPLGPAAAGGQPGRGSAGGAAAGPGTADSRVPRPAAAVPQQQQDEQRRHDSPARDKEQSTSAAVERLDQPHQPADQHQGRETGPPTSPLRFLGSKLLSIASAVLGSSGQTPAAPLSPHGGSSAQRLPKSRVSNGGEVIELMSDEEQEAALLPAAHPLPTSEVVAAVLGSGSMPLRPASGPEVLQLPPQEQQQPAGQQPEGLGGCGEHSPLETQELVVKKLKKRLYKYATLLQQEREAPQEPDGVQKLERKVRKLGEEYKAAKRKLQGLLQLRAAAGVSLPLDI
ncbi:hypothetical protein N2152v2_009453 [Parachlorella kessleri]